jgi:hypothetical protein
MCSAPTGRSVSTNWSATVDALATDRSGDRTNAYTRSIR